MDTALLTLLVIGLIVFTVYLYNRIGEFQKSLSKLEERLAYWEKDEATTDSIHATQHPNAQFDPSLTGVPPSVVTPPTPIVQHASPPVAFTAQETLKPIQPVFSPPPIPPLPVVEQKPSAPMETPPAVSMNPTPAAWNVKDVEALVGGNWLAKLGVIAIAIAMAFFLQYAFSKGLISPLMQVVAGLATSAFMLGAGQLLFKKETYRNYAQIVMSGGIMVYFLSIYASYNFYNPHLIGYTAAFAALAIGAVAASALALRNDTEAVAVLCTLGAFAAPILIRSSGVDSTPPYALYAYLTFLNLWVFALVRIRNWNSLAALGLGATWLLFFGAGSYQGRAWAVEGVAALFLFFSCYQGIQLLVAYDKSPEYSDIEDPPISVALGLGMILVGCLAFGAASASILLNAFLLEVSDVALAGAGLTFVLVWFSISLPRTGRYDKEVRLLFGYLASAAFVSLMLIALNHSFPISSYRAPSAFVFSVVTYVLFLGVSLIAFRRTKTPSTATLLVLSNAFVHLNMSWLALGTVSLWRVSALALWLPIAGWLGALGLWSVAKLAQKEEPFTKSLVLLAHMFSLVGFFVSLGGRANHIGAALFALEFLLISGTWIAIRKQTAWEWFRADRFALFANAVIFFGCLHTYTAPAPYHGVVPLAVWTLIMALYHALVGGFVLRKTGTDMLDRLLYFGIASTLIAVALSLQLKGSIITFAWATEAVALILAGLSAKDARVRAYGLALLTEGWS